MTVRKATRSEIREWLKKDAQMKKMISTGKATMTLFAWDEDDRRIGFLFAFYREIEAPLDGKTEWFVNVIDVQESARRKGVASALIQEMAAAARESNAVQIRAYCEIHNKTSHALWLKNGFGISPVKDAKGQIPGNFVTLRL